MRIVGNTLVYALLCSCEIGVGCSRDLFVYSSNGEHHGGGQHDEEWQPRACRDTAFAVPRTDQVLRESCLQFDSMIHCLSQFISDHLIQSVASPKFDIHASGRPICGIILNKFVCIDGERVDFMGSGKICDLAIVEVIPVLHFALDDSGSVWRWSKNDNFPRKHALDFIVDELVATSSHICAVHGRQLRCFNPRHFFSSVGSMSPILVEEFGTIVRAEGGAFHVCVELENDLGTAHCVAPGGGEARVSIEIGLGWHVYRDIICAQSNNEVICRYIDGVSRNMFGCSPNEHGFVVVQGVDVNVLVAGPDMICAKSEKGWSCLGEPCPRSIDSHTLCAPQRRQEYQQTDRLRCVDVQ
jgi:hypothetical protein